jgi:hypothetical protein
MDAFLAGASVAAQSFGNCGLADIIVEEQLGAERIAFLFDLSASKTRDTDLAVILTAGSIASYNVQPRGWSGGVEEALAREALRRDGTTRERLAHRGNWVSPPLSFEELTKRAAALVQKRWPEIAQLAAST